MKEGHTGGRRGARCAPLIIIMCASEEAGSDQCARMRSQGKRYLLRGAEHALGSLWGALGISPRAHHRRLRRQEREGEGPHQWCVRHVLLSVIRQ